MSDLLRKENMRIVVYTHDYKITGEIPTHEGYRGRLSDLLNEDKKFLNIINVELRTRAEDKMVSTLKFLCLNKDMVEIIHPIE